MWHCTLSVGVWGKPDWFLLYREDLVRWVWKVKSLLDKQGMFGVAWPKKMLQNFWPSLHILDVCLIGENKISWSAWRGFFCSGKIGIGSHKGYVIRNQSHLNTLLNDIAWSFENYLVIIKELGGHCHQRAVVSCCHCQKFCVQWSLCVLFLLDWPLRSILLLPGSFICVSVNILNWSVNSCISPCFSS